MRNLDINRYNINKYIYISIYFSKEKGIKFISRKVYIINNLNIKIFIKIDIIKLEDIILNL